MASDGKEITVKQHRERHEMLHKCLDELVADFIRHTDGLPNRSTVLALMKWSCKQMKNPTV